MSGIFGALNLNDTDRVFQAMAGQRVMYQAIVDYLARVNADIDAAMSVFVAGETQDFKLRYKSPGGGSLDRKNSQGRYGAGKAYGHWDVAFPLEDFGREIAGDDVSMAYMTVGDLERHVKTVVAQSVSTVRFEMLKALLDNAQDSFTDPLHGSLSIEPLANGDTVTYPPVVGSDSEATEDHYLESNYAASAISDSNNPFITIKEDLEHHFGISGDGYNTVVFVNVAEVPETEDLTDFDPVNDRYTRPGSNMNQLFGVPRVPGAIIGRTNGVWVARWDWIPANYMVGVFLDAEPPLMKRVDPQDTGLPSGLHLVTKDEEFPFESSVWRHRFGFGCANRLNGVVMELGTGGSYTIPTAYD